MPGNGWVHEPGLVAGLGLPPGVDDRAALVTNDSVIPHPGFGVDRLTHAAEQPQPRKVVFRRELIAELHQSADRGGRGVEDGDAMILTYFPEPAAVRVHRATLIQHHGRAGREWPVRDVAMPRDPTHVRCAPENVVLTQIENPL